MTCFAYSYGRHHVCRLSAELAELRKEVADRDSESRALFADKLQKQKDAMEEARSKELLLC